MSTIEDLQQQLDEIRNKRAALSSQVSGLNDQHSTSGASILGHDFAALDKIRFNSALKPLLMQDRVLHQQEQQLIQAQNRAVRDAKVAEQLPAQQAKAAAAAQKLKQDQQKAAAANLEDASARAFGLGDKKGIDYITKQGAFYDPKSGRVIVPESTKGKPAGEPKDNKGDPKAYGQVKDELAGFGKNAGVQGPLSPESFFGPNGFEMEQDKDGNYVYDANGTSVSIPAATADRLQEQYNASLPTPGESKEVAPSVKSVPADVFQQANAALNAIKGTNVIDPVEYALARNNRANLAREAIRQAVPDPATTGAMAIAGGAPATVPSVSGVSDIPATISEPNFASRLLAPLDPSFAAYRAKQKQIASVPSQVALTRGGDVSPADVVRASDVARDVLGQNADPAQLKLAANAALDQIASKNQEPALAYNLMAKPYNAVEPITKAINYLNPIGATANLATDAVKGGYDYLTGGFSSGLGPIVMGRDQRNADELAKEIVVQKIRNAISPDTSGEPELQIPP